jgi:hypothetical protein
VNTRSPSAFSGLSISTLPEAAKAPLSNTLIDLSALLTTTLGDFGAGSCPSEYSVALIAASTALNSRAAYSPRTMPGCVTSSGCDFSSAMTTVMPSLVTPNRSSAKSFGKRTHPCDAG